jgi:hypothetical protein
MAIFYSCPRFITQTGTVLRDVDQRSNMLGRYTSYLKDFTCSYKNELILLILEYYDHATVELAQVPSFTTIELADVTRAVEPVYTATF